MTLIACGTPAGPPSHDASGHDAAAPAAQPSAQTGHDAADHASMTMAGPGAGAAPETVTSTSSAPAALTEDSRVNRLPADPKGEAIPAGDPIPSVSVRVSGQNGSTWTFGVTTDMTLTMATGPYEPLKGHLHVFVDGVEKQMIATKTFTLANLAPGSHVIQVAAAATDHRNLLHDGRMVGAGVEVQVPAGTR